MSNYENGSILHAGAGSRVLPGPPSHEELLQNQARQGAAAASGSTARSGSSNVAGAVVLVAAPHPRRIQGVAALSHSEGTRSRIPDVIPLPVALLIRGSLPSTVQPFVPSTIRTVICECGGACQITPPGDLGAGTYQIAASLPGTADIGALRLIEYSILIGKGTAQIVPHVTVNPIHIGASPNGADLSTGAGQLAASSAAAAPASASAELASNAQEGTAQQHLPRPECGRQSGGNRADAVPRQRSPLSPSDASRFSDESLSDRDERNKMLTRKPTYEMQASSSSASGSGSASGEAAAGVKSGASLERKVGPGINCKSIASRVPSRAQEAGGLENEDPHRCVSELSMRRQGSGATRKPGALVQEQRRKKPLVRKGKRGETLRKLMERQAAMEEMFAEAPGPLSSQPTSSEVKPTSPRIPQPENRLAQDSSSVLAEPVAVLCAPTLTTTRSGTAQERNMAIVQGLKYDERKVRAPLKYLVSFCSDDDIEAALVSELENFEYALEYAGVGNEVLHLIKEVQPKYSPGNARSENEALVIGFILKVLSLVSTDKLLMRFLVNYTVAIALGLRHCPEEKTAKRSTLSRDRSKKVTKFEDDFVEALGENEVASWMNSYNHWVCGPLPLNVARDIAHALFYDGNEPSVDQGASRRESLDHWATFSECNVSADDEDALLHHARVLVRSPPIRQCIESAPPDKTLVDLKNSLAGPSEGSSKSFAHWQTAQQDLHLKKVLAYGAFGVVAAVSSKSKPQFWAAIKFVAHQEPKDLLESFVQPYLLLTTVDSPYVAKLYGFFMLPVRENDPFAVTALLMELGLSSLSSKIEERKKTPGDDYVLWSLEMAAGDPLRGLVALQDQGIVHRDVKPDNIVLGCDGCFKLIDGDFSVRIPTGETSIKTNCVGSPPYVNERHFREGIYDFSSDLYSVGVILIQLFRTKENWHPFVAMLLDGENDPMEKDLKVFLDRMVHRNDSGEAPVAFSNAEEALAGLEGLLEQWKTRMSVSKKTQKSFSKRSRKK